MLAGFHITGCPGQPFLPIGQPKVHPWLPDRATISFAIYLYIYVVGQPKCAVGQHQFDTGCPTGHPVFKTNVKPCCCKDSLNDKPGTCIFSVFKISLCLFLRNLHIIKTIFIKNMYNHTYPEMWKVFPNVPDMMSGTCKKFAGHFSFLPDNIKDYKINGPDFLPDIMSGRLRKYAGHCQNLPDNVRMTGDFPHLCISDLIINECI